MLASALLQIASNKVLGAPAELGTTLWLAVLAVIGDREPEQWSCYGPYVLTVLADH